jgi:hypothetical protein
MSESTIVRSAADRADIERWEEEGGSAVALEESVSTLARPDSPTSPIHALRRR